MRLSILALLIALPAAAYAGCQQPSTDPEPSPEPSPEPTVIQCGERGGFCDNNTPCCGRLQCSLSGLTGVCLMEHIFF